MILSLALRHKHFVCISKLKIALLRILADLKPKEVIRIKLDLAYFHIRKHSDNKSKFKRVRKLKAICALAMFMFFTASFSVISDNTDLADSLMYGDTLTAEDLGFPVDSYGLIVVDDEF